MTLTVSQLVARFDSLCQSKEEKPKKNYILSEVWTSLLKHQNAHIKLNGHTITFLDICEVPNVRDIEIQAIAVHCPCIVQLAFKSKQVTDVGISALASLISLETLRLGYNLEYNPSVSYAMGLQTISCLPKLRTLDLSGCHYLSPSTFHYLHQFKQLKELLFPKMSRISGVALEELELALPNTDISFGQNSPCRVSLY